MRVEIAYFETLNTPHYRDVSKSLIHAKVQQVQELFSP